LLTAGHCLVPSFKLESRPVSMILAWAPFCRFSRFEPSLSGQCVENHRKRATCIKLSPSHHTGSDLHWPGRACIQPFSLMASLKCAEKLCLRLGCRSCTIRRVQVIRVRRKRQDPWVLAEYIFDHLPGAILTRNFVLSQNVFFRRSPTDLAELGP
jgi:hypothetical protein